MTTKMISRGVLLNLTRVKVFEEVWKIIRKGEQEIQVETVNKIIRVQVRLGASSFLSMVRDKTVFGEERWR